MPKLRALWLRILEMFHPRLGDVDFDAVRQSLSNPENTIYGFKRLLGRHASAGVILLDQFQDSVLNQRIGNLGACQRLIDALSGLRVLTKAHQRPIPFHDYGDRLPLRFGRGILWRARRQARG